MPKQLPVQPQQVPKKRGRPKRQHPYVLPPLPPKKTRMSTKSKSEQRRLREVLQNNAASLRYRRRVTQKKQEQEERITESFQMKAKLLRKEARLKKAISYISQHVWKMAQQGCGQCLQTSLLLQTPAPATHPRVKIDLSSIEELKTEPPD